MNPEKLTPAVHKIIVDAIADGNYVKTAVQLARISLPAYYLWMKKGRKAKSGIYHDFYHAVMEAESVAESKAVLKIRQDTTWQSNAWWLERKYPDRWGKRERAPSEDGREAAKSGLDEMREHIRRGRNAMGTVSPRE